MNRSLPFAAGLVLGAALLASPALAQPAPANAPNIGAAIRDGALQLEFRPRYESVQQDGVADGEALSLRTRLGWTSARWRGLQATLEFEAVSDLGGDHNDGVPPGEPFATIADPEGAEINRLQLSWAPNDTVSATIGRQRILFDDQRFIGAVGWRQDDQTFDALRLDFNRGAFHVSYAYLDRINRIFAEELDWDAQSHLINASYGFGPALKVTAFAYLIDLEDGGAAQSNATYGVRASGAADFSGVRFAYSGSYATQSDSADAPAAYDADYWALDVSAARGPLTARAGIESLEGNGPGQRFVTPLATGHAFQGWADVFLATPNDGVVDRYVSASYRLPTEMPANSAITLAWHDFEAERTGAAFGEELDVQFTGEITPQLSFIVKYADYDGNGAPPDTRRTWFGLEYKL
jgi:hypothetical protein